MTPSFLSLAGGEIKIGVLNVKVATSISSAMPCGIALEVKFTFVSSTKDSEVQSKKLSVVCNSKAGLNSTSICSSICSFWSVLVVKISALNVSSKGVGMILSMVCDWPGAPVYWPVPASYSLSRMCFLSTW